MRKKGKVHFIAIGGSIMHSLAICLHKLGYDVSGSDDEIFEPAKSTLAQYGLLPEEEGWHTAKINHDLDFIILGMHAKPDNPEYSKAKELGIRILSFPELIYLEAQHKQRVVIAGSHGKTTITSMVMHILKESGKTFDYMVGAKINGFEDQVKITKDAPIMIIEGDEYLTSLEDRRPKFLNYFHHIVVISGIAWDHINVYPEYEEYIKQFKLLVEMTPRSGEVMYYNEDDELKTICELYGKNFDVFAYSTHAHKIVNGITYLLHEGKEYPLRVFGEHNINNLSAAKMVCAKLGISEAQFYHAISTFEGAARRLELIKEDTNKNAAIYKDFAHAPSKVKAATQSVKKQYNDRSLIACLELHTYSSLNKEFLLHYKNSLSLADRALIYYNPKTIALKKLESITPQQVKEAFGGNVEVYTDSAALHHELEQLSLHNATLLMMSSGNFDNLNLEQLASSLLS